jgi:dipeptide transport system permease protein
MTADADAAQQTTPEAGEPSVRPTHPLREFWFYFRESRGAVVGMAVIALVIFVAIFADILAPHGPTTQYRDSLLVPPVWAEAGSWTFPLGTDAVGRDILSRIMHGARFSMIIGLVVVTLSLSLGIALGLIAGFFRGIVDDEMDTIDRRVIDATGRTSSEVLFVPTASGDADEYEFACVQAIGD